jgi:glycosyltransferase involved in cell wall biosynthesis
VSQLHPYKQVELAVRACTRLARPLVVVGEGPERARLQALAGPAVTFLPRVDEGDLVSLYAGCAAFLQCGEEDFGIAALEAQACGRPVIAYGAGGALETVIEGETGTFFRIQSVDALEEALRDFDARRFDPAVARAQAERFDEAHFRVGMLRAIAALAALAAGEARADRDHLLDEAAAPSPPA